MDQDRRSTASWVPSHRPRSCSSIAPWPFRWPKDRRPGWRPSMRWQMCLRSGVSQEPEKAKGGRSPILSQGRSLFPLSKKRPRDRRHVAPAGGQEGDIDRHQADGLARARRRAQAVGRAPPLERLPPKRRPNPLVPSVIVSFTPGCRAARSRVGGGWGPCRPLHADQVALCYPCHRSSTEDGSRPWVNNYRFTATTPRE
jgi:hypothetical protein